MEYNVEDFDKMLFNVYALKKDEYVVDKFLILSKYKEFSPRGYTKSFADKMIRSIFYLYDRNSPLRNISNIYTRKNEAFILAGFKIVNDTFEDRVIELINFVNQDYIKMVIKFTRLFYDTDWVVLVSMEEALMSELIKMPTVSGTLKLDTTKNINEMRRTIDEIKLNILNGNDDVIMKREMNKHIIEIELKLTPEDIAEQLEKEKFIRLQKMNNSDEDVKGVQDKV
jgi:hypothetical protein